MSTYPKSTLLSLAFTAVAFLPVLATAAPTYNLTDLGVLPGGGGSVGCGVNNNGQVVGYGDDITGISRAILYTQGKLTNLGAVPDASYFSFG